MKDENVRNLLGGYATGTLSESERELLFTAALKDQELFDALADEEILRQFLKDPAARQRLLNVLEPQETGLFAWVRQPIGWALAGTAVAILAVVVVMRQAPPPPVNMARANIPSPMVAPKAAEQETELPRERKDLRAAPAATQAANKMKVAVLEFDSGPAPAKEAQAKGADLGKTASDLLVKKLDSDGYTVVDRKQVAEAVQAQKLNERQLNPAAAASLGRSLGADAVIMGAVRPQGFRPGVVGGVPAAAPAEQARKEAVENVEVTASAINTQNAANMAFVQSQQASPAALADTVDQVANSLGQQIQQNAQIQQNSPVQLNARVRIDGLVTEVNARNVTVNIGTRSGVRIGDRLEIRRGRRSVGRIVIQSVEDSSATGLLEGADGVRAGDSVQNQ